MASVAHKPKFAHDLLSKSGHDAIVKLNENEVKLLEHMKHYMTKRLKVERDYSSALSKINASASNALPDGDQDSSIRKAWAVFLKESDTKAQLINQFSTHISTNTFSKLDQLIQDRKSLLKRYSNERFRVDSEYKQESDEIDRLRRTYRDNSKESANAKSKYEEVVNKEKASTKEWDKYKDKFVKMTLKLHQNHNDYVLSLLSSNVHQECYYNAIVPAMLEYMQNLQESYVGEWKGILDDFDKFTDGCREEFASSSKNVHDAISEINKETEYDNFTLENKKNSPMCPFIFEPTLNEHVSKDLEPDKLVLNDLTHEKLTHKKTLLSQELQILEQQLEHKKRDLKIEMDNLKQVREDGRELLCVLQREVTVAAVSWQFEEMKCNQLKLEKKIDTVSEILNSIGNDPPPKFYNLVGAPSTNPVGEYNQSTPELRKSNRMGKLSTLFDKRKKSSSASSDDHRRTEPDGTADDDSDAGEYVEPPDDTPLEEEEWFHGKISREECKKRLQNNGEYLVRESATKNGEYVLSAKDKGALRHFIIQKTEEGGVRFEDNAFPTIRELLNYHTIHNAPVTKKSGAMLTTAIQRPDLKPAKDKWSISHSRISIQTKLGQGHFGDVMKGILLPENLPVAVKSCKENVSDVVKQKFLAEAAILKQYEHPNIVKLIGICADREPVYIVMELMPGGDFLVFLRKNSGNLDIRRLVKFSIDAASGMEYLASKNCIHRDLAARNCLIGDSEVLKISDFGMSREVEELYEATNMREIPVKWTAPEALNYAQYTTLSDIWSFGILLWETFSFGNTPYPGMNNKDTRERVEQGYRMPPPSGTPPSIYTIMKDCWNIEPSRRPLFNEIFRRLNQIHSSL